MRWRTSSRCISGAELDFVEEANNTELVARLLTDYGDLVVPQVIRPYVTEKVLVLERIEGRKVEAEHGLPAERAQELARELSRAYVHQVTVEGVYLRWFAFVGFCCAFLLGFYMVWKIIRTPGEL